VSGVADGEQPGLVPARQAVERDREQPDMVKVRQGLVEIGQVGRDCAEIVPKSLNAASPHLFRSALGDYEGTLPVITAVDHHD